MSYLQKYTFRKLKKQEKMFYSPNHLIYRGHSRKLQWLMPLLLNYSCTKWLINKIIGKIFSILTQKNFYLQFRCYNNLEADFRNEKYFNVFLSRISKICLYHFVLRDKIFPKPSSFLLYHLCN